MDRLSLVPLGQPFTFSPVTKRLVFITAGLLLCIIIAYLILIEKWFYLMGLLFVLIYSGLALSHQWEILLVMIFFVDLIWGYAMRRGFHYFFGFPVDHALFLLIGTVFFYFGSKGLRSSKEIRKENLISFNHILIVIFTIFLFIGWLTWLEYRDNMTNISYEWLRFGIAGLGAFILGNEVGYDPKRVWRFSAALFVFLLLISLEISARRLLDFELIPVDLGYDDFGETRFGITAYKYLPIFAGKGGDALLMVIALALGLGLISRSGSFLWRSAITAGLVSISSVLVLSLDRSGWIAGTAILIFWSIMHIRNNKNRKMGLIIACLIAAGIIALSVTVEIGGEGIKIFFFDFIRSDRYLLWYSTLKSVTEFPLFGIGYRNLDRFLLIMHRAAPNTPYASPLDDTIGQYPHPHNSYLDLMTFAGIPTFIIFSIFLYLVMSKGWKALRRSDNNEFKITLSAIYSALIGLCIFSFFNSHLWVWPTNLLFWILSGTVAGLSRSLSGNVTGMISYNKPADASN